MLIKKELATLPEANKKGKPMSFAVSFAELPRCGKVMVMAVYDSKGQCEGRMFLDGKNITSVDSQGKWDRLHRQYAKESAAWSDHHKTTDKEEKRLAADFLGVKLNEYNEPLHDWARQKRYVQWQKREDVKKARYDKYSPLFRAEDPFNKREHRDFDRYVNSLFDSTYGIIDRKKKQTCTCGQCRKTFEPAPRGKVGKTGTCPHCGTTLVFATDNTPQTSKHREREFTFATRRRGAILVGIVSVVRNVSSEGTTHSYSWDRVNIYPDTGKDNVLYYYSNGGSFMGYYVDYGWHELLNEDLFVTAKTYTKNLKQVFGDNWHGVNIPEFFTKYLEGKKLSLDQIVYSAFHGYAEPFIKNGFSSWVMARPWMLKGMLKLKKGDKPCFSTVFGMLPDMKAVYLNCDVTPAEHRIFSNFPKEYISEAEVARYRNLSLTGFELHGKPDFTFKKLLNYLEKQAEKGYMAGFAMNQLYDYWKFCAEQHIELTHKSVKWPDDVKDAHDRLLALKNLAALEEKRKEAEKKAAQFAKTLKKLAKLDGYTNGVYEMHMPHNFDDFIAEGTALNNCVARLGYYDKQANGDCFIVFLRRSIEPERPFFCMELGPSGMIRQLRGYGNCCAPGDIQAFADEFVQKFKKTVVGKKAAVA